MDVLIGLVRKKDCIHPGDNEWRRKENKLIQDSDSSHQGSERRGNRYWVGTLKGICGLMKERNIGEVSGNR